MKLIDLDNRSELDIDTQRLEEVAQTFTQREIELIVTDNVEIQKLNAQYRDKNIPTDVLSFPIEMDSVTVTLENIPLGSIVISENLIKEKAEMLGHSTEDELMLLFIHGLLHLLGFDHESDQGEMREIEKKIILDFALPLSLIIRNEEN